MTATVAAGAAEGVEAHPRDERARVLWVTADAPNRNKRPSDRRQAAILNELCEHADVTLLLAGELRDDEVRARCTSVREVQHPGERAPRSRVVRRARDLGHVLARRRPAEVIDAKAVRRALAPVVRTIASDFDAVVVHGVTLAPLAGSRSDTHWVLEAHDVPSARADLKRGVVGRRQRWLLSREAAKARRYQRKAVRTFDAIVVAVDDDARALARKLRAQTIVVPRGVTPPRYPPSQLPEAPNILMPAPLDDRASVLGAIWFCDEVLPLVRTRVPETRVAIAGRDPIPEALALAERPGVEVHTIVPRLQPWYDWARVVVAPRRARTVGHVDVRDALAMERPIVGTSIELDGLALVDRVDARIVDEAEAMADAIVELLADDQRAATLAAAARAHAEERFRWDRSVAPLASWIGARSVRQAAAG